MKTLLLTLAALIALLGAFMIWLGSSESEATSVNIGTLLGRNTREPTVGTVSLGVGALVVAGVLVLASTLTRARARLGA
jgi:hypothetical protein